MLEVVLFTPQWKHSSTIWRLIGNVLCFLLVQIIYCFHHSHILFYVLCQNSQSLSLLYWNTPSEHSWYLSKPPPPAVVYFFPNQLSIFFAQRTQNFGLFWPILAILHTFGCTFIAVVSQNWHNSDICRWDDSEIKVINPNLVRVKVNNLIKVNKRR